MPKLHCDNHETENKSNKSDASALSRRTLLVVAGQTAAVGMLAACEGKEPQGPGSDMRSDLRSASQDLRSPNQDLRSPDLSSGADLSYVCMPKVATGAELLAENDAQHFYDSTVPKNSFFVARDAKGFFALRNVCSHQQCQTQFNTTAKTYDCPCHGSRYNLDGTVLQGPTLEPLKSFPMIKRGDGMLEVDSCGPGSTDLSGRVT